MEKSKQRDVASKGGKAAHLKGVAHEWTSEEARQAGRKGGQTSASRRKALLDAEREAEQEQEKVA
jgi:hypothetical protein